MDFFAQFWNFCRAMLCISAAFALVHQPATARTFVYCVETDKDIDRFCALLKRYTHVG